MPTLRAYAISKPVPWPRTGYPRTSRSRCRFDLTCDQAIGDRRRRDPERSIVAPIGCGASERCDDELGQHDADRVDVATTIRGSLPPVNPTPTPR